MFHVKQFVFSQKGRSYKKELVESQKNWKFDLNLIDSNTSEDSKVIVLKGLERVS